MTSYLLLFPMLTSTYYVLINFFSNQQMHVPMVTIGLILS